MKIIITKKIRKASGLNYNRRGSGRTSPGNIYGARAGLNIALFASDTDPPILSTAANVENYPGFIEISGWDLIDRMTKHAEDYTKIISEVIGDIKKKDDEFIVTSSRGKEYNTKTIIIATGA